VARAVAAVVVGAAALGAVVAPPQQCDDKGIADRRWI
jgi:hypothetical protein